jgi:hypothetical protein
VPRAAERERGPSGNGVPVARPVAQVRVEREGVHDLAGIHPAARIEDRLEPAEGVDEVRPVHQLQQLAARLAVTVLARERAAERHDQLRGPGDEAPVGRQPVLRVEVEVVARVDAALAEVAVQGARVAELRPQRRERAQVGAELLRRDRGVLPALEVARPVGGDRCRAETRLADEPHPRLPLRVLVAARRHAARQAGDESVREPVGLGGIVGAELGDQPAAALGEEREVLHVQRPRPHLVDEGVVEPLQRQQRAPEQRRNRVGGGEDVRVAQDDESPMPRADAQAQRRLGDHGTGGFRADQGAGDVEAALGEELVEVVAADPPRDHREPCTHQALAAAAQIAEARQHLGQAAPAGDGRGIPGIVVGADVERRAAVLDDRQPLDVVDGLARVERVASARVVADHPPEGAPGVRRRIGPEREAVLLSRASEVVEDDARLHPRGPRDGVDGEDPRHVSARVDHDGDVAGLAGETGAGTPGEDRRVVLGAHPQRSHDVVVVEREDDAERHLAIVRRIRGIHGPRAGIEADLAADNPPEGRLQCMAPGLRDARPVDPTPRRGHRAGTVAERAPGHRAASDSPPGDAASRSRA